MKTVLCHGCFDVIHAGHLKHFQKAKQYGDYLIVSITTDRFVNKGPGRPYFSHERRADMLRALSIVDEVSICDDPTAIPSIEKFKPDFYVKGSDYREASNDITGEIVNERKAVEGHGGQLVFTDEETFSSSAIINRNFQPFTPDQQRVIASVQDLGGVAVIERAIAGLSALKVLVVGEPIIDVYRFVRPEGISSKSPTVSCRFLNEETYFGGTTAIYNHLRDFCDVELLSPLTKSRVYPSKIRYIEPDKSQRIFEVTEIWEDEWLRDDYMERLKAHEAECMVVADFGHGLFEGSLLEAMKGLNGFIGLNVQTNSSNFGYNVYTKHSRYDYLCLDTREARLAEHDRFGSPLEVAQRIQKTSRSKLGLTLGSNGSYLLGDSGDKYSSPAFTDQVLDATGAGDAYFAITTVLLASGCPPALIPFIGNVFAGLKTKILGNKASVSKASLLKAIRGILA